MTTDERLLDCVGEQTLETHDIGGPAVKAPHEGGRDIRLMDELTGWRVGGVAERRATTGGVQGIPRELENELTFFFLYLDEGTRRSACGGRRPTRASPAHFTTSSQPSGSNPGGTMRKIRVPHPVSVWGIEITGPVSPSAPHVEEARRLLDEGLASTPELDAALEPGEWCLLWGSATLPAGPLVKRWVWIDRSDRGADLAAAIVGRLEERRFIARRGPRPGAVDEALRPRALYLRTGSVQLGLGTDFRSALDRVDLIEEARSDIDLGLRFRFRRQRCPVCGIVDHPAQIVGGFPMPDLLVAEALGEVVLTGCDVDPTVHVNARCRHCGTDYLAR